MHAAFFSVSLVVVLPWQRLCTLTSCPFILLFRQALPQLDYIVKGRDAVVGIIPAAITAYVCNIAMQSAGGGALRTPVGLPVHGQQSAMVVFFFAGENQMPQKGRKTLRRGRCSAC